MITFDRYLTVNHREYVVKCGEVFPTIVIDAEFTPAPSIFHMPRQYYSLAEFKFGVCLELVLWRTEIVEYFLDGFFEVGVYVCR